MKSELLVVEDHDDSYLLIERALCGLGNIERAKDLTDAVQSLQKKKYSILMLDIELPDGDGLSLLQRALPVSINRQTPVIIISGRSAIQDKLTGFDLGATDYVTKPFEPLELKARVMARLTSVAEPTKLVSRFLELDLHSHKAWLLKDHSKIPLNLTKIEFQLLQLLLENEGSLLSREQLLDSVWGEDVFVDHRSVDAHISRLRKKLEEEKGLIQSVHGLGYRFAGDQAEAT